MVGRAILATCGAVAGVVVLGLGGLAQAAPLSETFSFQAISGGGGNASDYTVEVSQSGSIFGTLPSSQVSFVFRNNAPTELSSSIRGVYFQNGTLMNVAMQDGEPMVSGSEGVSFDLNASPGHLPGGMPYGFKNASRGAATFSAGASHPGASTLSSGVKSGQYVEFIFDLKPGKTYSDVLSALRIGFENPFASDALLIGLHVQNFDGSNSASLVVIPLPAPVLMGLAGLVGVIGVTAIRRRRIGTTAPTN